MMCLNARSCWRRISKQLQKLLYRQSTLNQKNSVSSASVKVRYLDDPDKSEGDKKMYRALCLPNGLRAMLISDPRTNEIPHKSTSFHQEAQQKNASSTAGSSNTSLEFYNGKLAACAVLVEVGSFSEPMKFQGLAHFVEHMVFMGSEKYPGENAFDSFVTKNGGFSNASTSDEYTCFYFDVEEAHFDKSLDYFMNLMKAPLMEQDAMTRERSAVQSEFEQAFMSDDVRRDQILASLATEGYPHGTFSWGNVKSLQDEAQDIELHKALHEFRQKHYISNRMIVCLQAGLSLDELEQLLITHCSDIPSNVDQGLNVKDLHYDKAFREQFFQEVFLVKPVEDMCKVEMTWVLPPMIPYYRSKPDSFFAQLLGYEGEGSLCSYLRKRLWCMSIIAGAFDNNSIYSLFNICIYLTDEGFDHLDEVLMATFAWLKLFNDCNTLNDFYKEIQQIADNNFRFQIEVPAFQNVGTMARRIKNLPPKDVLTGFQIYFEYEEEPVNLLKQHLSSFNFNIMITSHIPYKDCKYDQKERWFGTQYTTMPIPQKWVDMWQDPQAFPDLALPPPNPFVTTDFRIHWNEAGRPQISRKPKTLIKDDKCELWFRQDDTFLLPDGFICLYFITPLVRLNVRNYMMAVVYTYLVDFCIAEQLYPAIEAGLTYRLFIGEKGLFLIVNGYNDKLPLLLEIILKVMSTLDLDPAQVVSFKELKKRQIFNALISAKSLNLDLRLSLLESQRFNMLDRYEILDTIFLDDIQFFKENFHKEMYVQGLIQGNFTEQQALDIMSKVLMNYKSEKIQNFEILNNSLVQLPLGSHYLKVKALNREDTNSIVTNYYQIGPSDIRQECLMDLVEMIVEEPLFHQLRTQEQLGYSLSIHQRIGYGVLAFIITVNSQETINRAEYVEQRIEAFRARIPELVQELSDEEFLAVRESLISGKKLADTSLEDEVMRNWNEIVNMEYFFNRIDKQIQMMNTLSKEDVLQFLADYESNHLRKLSVQVVGKQTAPVRTPTDSISSAVMSRQESTVGPGKRQGSLNELLEEVQQTISEEQLLFERMGDNIKLEFIGNSNDGSHIVDIADFKKNLYIYPVINTNP
ncbi:nardilysin, partial [Scaptodrosophila lebanonensis]|uniref:Nardilysin n=1 Tax=Drosophila lebanonensis TaxID=7225 RepID=A0A6J2U598_DROLE